MGEARFAKRVLALGAALAGFVGANAVCGWVLERQPELRLPAGSSEGQKIAEYRRNAAEYDTVFIGTSRVLRGIDPRVFDARMAELGKPTRSYNFGLNGMGFLEELHLVDWILEQRPDRLRYLFMEPTERDAVMRLVGRDVHKANLFTMRTVYWHGFEETKLGIEATWGSPRTREKKIELTRLHLLHAAHRLSNVGALQNLLGKFLAPSLGEDLIAGFAPRDPEGPQWEEVEDRPQRETAVHEPHARLAAVFEELASRTRAAGVRPIFVMPPTPQPPALSRFIDARGWKGSAEMLHYSPATYPEILADEGAYFYDEGHLNLAGAAVFSERLATDFAALLDKP